MVSKDDPDAEAEGPSPKTRVGKNNKPPRDTRDPAPPPEERIQAEHKRAMQREAKAHEREEASRDAAHERRKYWALFVVGAGLGACVVIVCVVLALRQEESQEVKKVALAGLVSLFTAALGYLAGKNSKS